jgi:hypothetical protein
VCVCVCVCVYAQACVCAQCVCVCVCNSMKQNMLVIHGQMQHTVVYICVGMTAQGTEPRHNAAEGQTLEQHQAAEYESLPVSD